MCQRIHETSVHGYVCGHISILPDALSPPSMNTLTHSLTVLLPTSCLFILYYTFFYRVQKLHHVNLLSNVKNVYFGKLHGIEFVYKKLAHDAELQETDRLICNGALKRCSNGYNNNNLCVFPKLVYVTLL